MYAVDVSRSARKEIRDLDAAVVSRVIATLRRLADDPRPPGCKKLVGSRDLWRVRVGDYRIVYRIDDARQAIEIVIVRHRSAAYE
jgi:mRNA interferase RelE/StbE